MKLNIINVGLGVLSLVGGFLPMASAGSYFASISHIGGLAWLLYPLSLAAIGLAVTAIYKPDIRHLRLWIGVVTLAGLILTLLTVSAGISTLNYMANSMSSFSFLRDNSATAEKVSASIGSGGVMAVAGYLCLLLLSLNPLKSSSAKEGGQK